MKTHEQLENIRDELENIRNMGECLAYSNVHMTNLDIYRVLFAYEKAFDLLNEGKQLPTDDADRQLAIIRNNASTIVRIIYEFSPAMRAVTREILTPAPQCGVIKEH